MAGLAQTMMGGGGFKPMGFLQMAGDSLRDKDKPTAVRSQGLVVDPPTIQSLRTRSGEPVERFTLARPEIVKLPRPATERVKPTALSTVAGGAYR